MTRMDVMRSPALVRGCAGALAITTALACMGAPAALASGPTETLATLQAALDSASPGATVALSGNVTGATGTDLAIPAGENLTLDLAGYALSVDTTGTATAAVLVPAGSGLTIEDTSSGHTGTLSAISDQGGAAIGSSSNANAGNVTITGGTITADAGGSGNSGSGIGAGYTGSEGNITISGGSVSANGGTAGAGIGGSSTNAVIAISGGSVNATGGPVDAGIGGAVGSMPAAIDISGGSVNATGGDYAAGIGSGYDNAYAGNITISGGTVTAVGGLWSAGIGDGVDSDNSGAITISSGSVTATGGAEGPGIGNTNNGGTNFAVTLRGGLIDATGGTDAPGIGVGSTYSGTVALTAAGTPIGSAGTDGGASTGGGTVATVTNAAGPLSYTDATTAGTGGAAKFTFYYPVSFDLDGHGSAISSQLVAYGADVTQPAAPTTGGYSFGGWYSDAALSDPFSFSTGITPAAAPLTLYAKWSVIPAQATTTNPMPTHRVQNPRIIARVRSASRREHGWYRKPVRISFSCERGSAPLQGRCPAAVTLARSGARQRLRRTIRATDGGHATVTVAGINIDRVAPRVAITGVRANATYLALNRAPAARCRARDRLSGVASCRLTVKREGATIVYRATATDRAGNRSSAATTIRVSPFTLSGTIPSLGAYTVRRQHTYTFSVLAATQPRYIDAAPWPQRPSGASVLFTRAGSSDGVPEWSVRVTIDTAQSNGGRWNLGYLVGGSLHSATVTVTP